MTSNPTAAAAEIYLEAEIRRYFHDALEVEVTHHEDETIEINIGVNPNGTDPDYTLVMNIGSDDDYYIFSEDPEQPFAPGIITITIPYPAVPYPEA